MTDQEINEAVARKLLGWDDEVLKDIKPPDYCHSIEAAWEILQNQPFMKLIKNHDEGWRCKLGEFYPGVEVIADTAPMAICLAFLKLS